ncbi:hypothetical protein [Paracoccus sp. IB05]|uniref:hypothetical protein n=1 Tax=Paracoccus sp. IB05 TaxID=2779367 RepID=UPI001E56B6A1|nr:hypothetical protein [Paracoccus sp. IB05]
MLGLARAPAISITRAPELFRGLAEERIHGKDANQLRIWRNQCKRAMSNLIEVTGDIAINDISRDNALDFRQWWWERIRDEGLAANSTNKDISTLSGILHTVNDMKRLRLDLPLEKLAFTEGEQNTRLPFSDEWILDHILRQGGLNGLNDQAHDILRIMINTGCRPAEIAGLLPGHIHLEHDDPHISIEPEGRQLKRFTRAGRSRSWRSV